MSGAQDGTLRAWNILSGVQLACLHLHQPIVCFEFTTDASRIVLQLRQSMQPAVVALMQGNAEGHGVTNVNRGSLGGGTLEGCQEGKENVFDAQPGRARQRQPPPGRGKLLRSLTMPAHVMGMPAPSQNYCI